MKKFQNLNAGALLLWRDFVLTDFSQNFATFDECLRIGITSVGNKSLQPEVYIHSKKLFQEEPFLENKVPNLANWPTDCTFLLSYNLCFEHPGTLEKKLFKNDGSKNSTNKQEIPCTTEARSKFFGCTGSNPRFWVFLSSV
jgi:hypothetical protein